MPTSPRPRTRATAPGPRYRVFVSHATADKWIAKTICEKIDAIEGAGTFRDDRDIEGGDDIPDRLREELVRCDELVLILTTTSADRKWVILEVGACWGYKKRIVPICYNVAVDQFPILSKTKAYHLNDSDRYLGELRGRIEKGRA